MSESKFFCFGKNDFCDDAYKDKSCEKCRHMDWHGGEMRTVPKSPRLNREAWEPCDFCKTELNKYPYILACDEYSESNTVYEPGFCPLCGRPLIEEAWAMLEKRLEGTRK